MAISKSAKSGFASSPGPRPRPIIGNLRDLPNPDEQDWQHWLKHKALYGPISSLNVLGKTIIILNDAQLATQLLEKRSAIHSSRPQQNFTEMSGWQNVLGGLRNPEHVRMTRKYLYQEIGSNNSVACFNNVQITEVSRFLLRVMHEPEKLQQHIRKLGGIVLKIAYGYTIDPHSPDPLVDLADKAMEDFSSALLPTAWAVNFIPILRYIPAWFPGAGFIEICQAYKRRAEAFSDVPYEFVRQQMDTSVCVPSFLSNLLQKCEVGPGSEEERIIKWSAGSLYAGGADTTVSAIASFFLAMAFYPEVQQKAQKELDTVVGGVGLAQFEDRARLPYIDALVKEVLRWHPVVPTNIPHVSTQNDTCAGYFIPKGSSIVANIWGFTHDPNVYSDPMAFKPERFLASPDGHSPERDPHMLVFGFGRRACPGRTLADSNIFLTIARSLNVFQISKPLKGPESQDLKVKFLPGVISHPAPFKLSIQPRTAAHRDLIQSLEQSFPWEKGDAEFLSGVHR
ncbi:hypothetical protein N7494_010308 [Penicillium frequentans]|uniref:O-methylsterigmatocystin oxidoreductase n=1 Tax=Penicillium frequentans TaxID=3151616 RepID=A0AAD6CIB2_9EURO|nr:hypothetical protein N7494_010308 [Penicillium glabrum]